MGFHAGRSLHHTWHCCSRSCIKCCRWSRSWSGWCTHSWGWVGRGSRVWRDCQERERDMIMNNMYTRIQHSKRYMHRNLSAAASWPFQVLYSILELGVCYILLFKVWTLFGQTFVLHKTHSHFDCKDELYFNVTIDDSLLLSKHLHHMDIKVWQCCVVFPEFSQTPEGDVCTGPLRVLEQKPMQWHTSDEIQVLFYPTRRPVFSAFFTLFDIWFRLQMTFSYFHDLFSCLSEALIRLSWISEF